jgi:hypothetical protein
LYRYRAQLRRDAQDCRVAAVDKNLRGRATLIHHPTVEIRWNYDTDRYMATAQQRFQFGRRRYAFDILYNLRCAHVRNKLARQVGVGLVRDRCAKMSHICIDRIAKQQDLDNG